MIFRHIRRKNKLILKSAELECSSVVENLARIYLNLIHSTGQFKNQKFFLKFYSVCVCVLHKCLKYTHYIYNNILVKIILL